MNNIASKQYVTFKVKLKEVKYIFLNILRVYINFFIKSHTCKPTCLIGILFVSLCIYLTRSLLAFNTTNSSPSCLKKTYKTLVIIMVIIIKFELIFL